MVDVCLFNNCSDSNVISKNLINRTVFSGILKSPLNILSPTIRIEGDNLYNFNYAYIEVLNRYYYINDVIIIKNRLFDLNLSVDVLKTYEQDIRASQGLIDMQANYNPYYGKFEIESKKQLERKNFNNPFNLNGINIMVTIRG